MSALLTTDRDGDCAECAGDGFDYVLHGCRQDVVRCLACHGTGVALVCSSCLDNGPACECGAPEGICNCAPCGACGGRS